LAVWLKRPESRIDRLRGWISDRIGQVPSVGAFITVETEIKYAGYLDQQKQQIRKMQDSEGRMIPDNFGYDNIPGLSNEVRQKLKRVRPGTLGQASRIPGVTPAAVAVLDIYLNLSKTNVSRETYSA
jgi:tRNA uridine 5-carboxymethylaminomethyl modification enzyme